MLKSRLNWTDMDWANYLGCPVHRVSAYRQILDNNLIPKIECDKKTGKYFFALYRYDVAKNLQLMMSADRQFNRFNDAACDANNIISISELDDYWAEQLHIPNKAIQMMLIRNK